VDKCKKVAQEMTKIPQCFLRLTEESQ